MASDSELRFLRADSLGVSAVKFEDGMMKGAFAAMHLPDSIIIRWYRSFVGNLDPIGDAVLLMGEPVEHTHVTGSQQPVDCQPHRVTILIFNDFERLGNWTVFFVFLSFLSWGQHLHHDIMCTHLEAQDSLSELCRPGGA